MGHNWGAYGSDTILHSFGTSLLVRSDLVWIPKPIQTPEANDNGGRAAGGSKLTTMISG